MKSGVYFVCPAPLSLDRPHLKGKWPLPGAGRVSIRWFWKFSAQCLCPLMVTLTVCCVFFSLSPCATDHQETCARILLYRGADKDVKNNSGQTPFQVWGCRGWLGGGMKNTEGVRKVGDFGVLGGRHLVCKRRKDEVTGVKVWGDSWPQTSQCFLFPLSLSVSFSLLPGLPVPAPARWQ